MKSLSLLTLVHTLGLGPAVAQQEVDPDHFDQPVSKAAVQPAHHAACCHARPRDHVKMASKHANRGHHPLRVSA
jgi:hypothetical protein